MHIKKQRFTLTLALLALAGWALSVRGLSAAAGETDRNQPSTRAAAPATQPRPVDNDFEAGRAQARKDLAAGRLGHKLAVPEAFMLEWMHAQDDDANLLDYYKAIVADRFGVLCEEVVILPNYGDRVLRRAAGYNDAMSDAITKRCGDPDALDKAWKEACATSGPKRAAYLKARAAAPPATRPAGTAGPARNKPDATMNK